MAKKLYLLVNLGTPEAPTSEAVAAFLKEFLSDPLVIDIPALWRWLLVHVLIVPRRSRRVAQAYKSIWTERGSPLRFHTEDLAQALRKRVDNSSSHGVEVRWAMRYGEPSIERALKGVDPKVEIKVLPLYPQYALSSTQSTVEELKVVVEKLRLKNRITYLPHFYSYGEFISAYVDVFKRYVPDQWDHILFSFHGLPVRHLAKVAQGDCLSKPNCCEEVHLGRQFCYRAHLIIQLIKWPINWG